MADRAAAGHRLLGLLLRDWLLAQGERGDPEPDQPRACGRRRLRRIRGGLRGIFSPNRATYDLTVKADALVATTNASNFQQPQQTNQLAYVTDQGNPAHLRGLDVSVFGFQSVRADAVVDYRPGLQVEWHVRERGIEGESRTQASVEIEDVAVIGPNTGTLIGTLKPGESKDFTGSLANLNGGSVSDQVYGFNNFDPSAQSDRSLMARRAVIDSLVGMGGAFAMKGGAPGPSLGPDSGPFVVGWRPDPGPVEISVDGRVVQRYDQTVEVINGRPTFGPGPVRIEAAQISTRIVSTAGEASIQQPGFVSLGNGEVVFDLGLPLRGLGHGANQGDPADGSGPEHHPGKPGGPRRLPAAGVQAERSEAGHR